MKRAIIATIYNEANNVSRWWESLSRQTVLPDEIVIVDGGSTDGTWEILQQLAAQCPVPVKLEQRHCNIAQGRNRAITLTDAEIIAANDAGSFPDKNWFGEISRPLVESSKFEVVGGHTENVYENEFQKMLERLEPHVTDSPEVVSPSSRNVAFRRQAWADAGGYPEWLTLTAEDALFNFALHKIGKPFAYNPLAIVKWPVRDTPEAYLKMLRSYGYGAAEARLYTGNFMRNLAVTLFPPALLLSRHRQNHLKFRYQKNAAAALGWLAGKVKGNRAPLDWRRFDGVLLSPAAQIHFQRLARKTEEASR